MQTVVSGRTVAGGSAVCLSNRRAHTALKLEVKNFPGGLKMNQGEKK